MESAKDNHHDTLLEFSCVLPPPMEKSSGEKKSKRLVYDQRKLWPKTRKQITVFFLDTSDEARNEKVLQVAKTWEPIVGLKIVRTKNQDQSDIRISYNYRGAWSYLGTDCLKIPKNEPTMNYGWFYTAKDPDEAEYRATTIHEFGHALGFEHELQHPYFKFPWDEAKVIEAYKKSQGWTEQQIRQQVLNRIDITPYTRADTAFDPLSIMCYTIQPKLLKEEFQNAFPVIRNNKLSWRDKRKAREAYHMSLDDFPINCKVRVKSKKDVLQEFSIVRRGDYEPFMDQFNDKEGVVSALHPTNGVQVSFGQGADATAWYEPECLIKLDNLFDTHPGEIKRLYPDTKVKVNSLNSEYHGQVGTVLIHLDKDLKKVTLIFDGEDIALFELKELSPTSFFYKEAPINFVLMGLTNYPIGTEVTVKDSIDAIKQAFEFAQRDDYEKEIESYSGKQGVVDLLHPTNGVRVKFADNKKFWFEPRALKVTKTGNGSAGITRIPPRSLVVIKKLNSELYGQVKEVVLYTGDDYTKIHVLDDNKKVEVDPKFVQITDYYY